jgi:hypothetical protein
VSNAPPADVWIHPALRIAPSAIAGQGLVLAEDVAAGAVLLRLGGRLVDSERLAQLIAAANADPTVPYVDTITVDEDSHLVLPSGSPAHFGNHSCDPNTWHVGPYTLAARRVMGAGDEVTIDYGTSSGASGFRMACTCRSALCRGVVTSEDWRRPELQARYAGHWVPALADRITRTGGSGNGPSGGGSQ